LINAGEEFDRLIVVLKNKERKRILGQHESVWKGSIDKL